MCFPVPFGELEPSQGWADLAIFHTLLQGCWRGQENGRGVRNGWNPHPSATRAAQWRKDNHLLFSGREAGWQPMSVSQMLSRERRCTGAHPCRGRLHTGILGISKTLEQKPEAETFDSEMDSVPYAIEGNEKPSNHPMLLILVPN